MYRFIEFLKEMCIPLVAILCIAMAGILWVIGNAQERIADRATPEETPAIFQRIGPEFEVDGLYRVDYESKTYLLYQSNHRTVIIEHTSGDKP